MRKILTATAAVLASVALAMSLAAPASAASPAKHRKDLRSVSTVAPAAVLGVNVVSYGAVADGEVTYVDVVVHSDAPAKVTIVVTVNGADYTLATVKVARGDNMIPDYTVPVSGQVAGIQVYAS